MLAVLLERSSPYWPPPRVGYSALRPLRRSFLRAGAGWQCKDSVVSLKLSVSNKNLLPVDSTVHKSRYLYDGTIR